jgi:hypothetical protein
MQTPTYLIYHIIIIIIIISVHLWMGGEMRLVAISPNDPVFWLHHAFVDKVYHMWQRRHGFDKYTRR